MIERVVRQFISSYFVGVKEVSFYLLGDRRNIQIEFNTHDDLTKSWALAGEAKEMFFVDEEQLVFQVDRDLFEAIMFSTAAKDAMDVWVRKLIEENDRQECEVNEDDERGSSKEDPEIIR